KRAYLADSMVEPPSSAERSFDHGEGALAVDVIDCPHSEHRMQLLGGHLHWSGRGGGARRRLRECRRPCSMERDVPLDLLLDLMDVAVEHGHRTETLQIPERTGGILCTPSPFLVNRP